MLTIYSLRCVQLIAGVLGRAGESGQSKRMEAAESGKVTWETPQMLQDWWEEEQALKLKDDKERRKLRNSSERENKVAMTKQELLGLAETL